MQNFHYHKILRLHARRPLFEEAKYRHDGEEYEWRAKTYQELPGTIDWSQFSSEEIFEATLVMSCADG